MGGRNVSCVWRPDASEFGKEQTDIDESVIAKRFRSLRRKNSKRRLRTGLKWSAPDAVGLPEVSGISVGNRREQSIVPQTEAVVSRKRNLWSLRPTMLGLGNDWGCGVENVEVR